MACCRGSVVWSIRSSRRKELAEDTERSTWRLTSVMEGMAKADNPILDEGGCPITDMNSPSRRSRRASGLRTAKSRMQRRPISAAASTPYDLVDDTAPGLKGTDALRRV